MKTTKDSEDYRSEQLDQMIQSSIQWDPLDGDFIPKGNGEILDFYREKNKLFVVHDKLENTPADTYALVKDTVAKL